jgi:hypothetical protein
MADRKYLEDLSLRLAGNGRIMESGWVSLRLEALPLNTPADRLREMRMAYMAGAQYVLGVMSFLDETGLRRGMETVNRELEGARKELESWVRRPKGSA